MWDKWKKKIQNFIWEEVEVEDTETIKQPKNEEEIPNIEAKMVYQYPKSDSFHFPVIPNQTKRREQTEVPAFKRRASREPIQISNSLDTSFTPQENKETKRPFQASEVPSPIYGFKPRKQKEVENVPAFVRKKEDRVEENKTENINDEKPVETIVSNHQEAPADNRLQQINSNEKETEDNQSTNRLSRIEEQSSQTKKEKTNKLDRPRRNVRDLHTERKSNQSVPYNVLMTPRDKKNLFDKQKHNQNKVSTNLNQDSQPTKQVEDQQVNQSMRQPLPVHLLDDSRTENKSNDLWVKEQQELLEKTLKYFNVKARVVHATQGPSVTRFEIQPELGVKVSKIKNLSDDLKLNMAARDIRIEAPIPGKNTVGIEVPNPKAQMVSLQDIVESNTFKDSASPLTIALGLSIEGSPIVTNIQKMPHGLIAGATGSGKSVCINTFLISLIYKASYEDVKFLLIDPKMVELAPYNGIPHLVSPVITDVKAATAALKWAVSEMEERYDQFVHEGVRDIERFNQKMKKENRNHEKMPYIVIVIDELADLMMVSPQDVEDAICRIAQKARACGIHLLLATQRPSVDVITGLIKANIPTRIAFSVSSQIDSRTIIDTSGAEKLLGKGDMLFIENGAGKSVRIQGPFVSDDEIERVTSYARKIAEPDYLFEQDSLLQQMTVDEEEDELLQEVIQFILEQNSASTSLLQRHFKIGYNRAARLIDTLESKGIISGQNGSKPRDILITASQINDVQ
ncbi:DNA translocase FtsK [Ornithinibacillus sp. L9]|uniref:DNA translocase FtsK n=1 Tax=Ornithinibacillus caprae TaxID=2678566 RepID=A0A6N8FBT5_9BACI|nr:DNA translocase FtsK [Ornithinibacillus caprae]MUK86805.1 DNA translocase FtsK [Ornithinibacillus caprae]